MLPLSKHNHVVQSVLSQEQHKYFLSKVELPKLSVDDSVHRLRAS